MKDPNQFTIFILLSTALIVSIFLIFFRQVISRQPIYSLGNSCNENGGIWLQKYQECESVAKEWCQKQNGKFDPCESSCRHNLKVEACPFHCVQVCNFANTNNQNQFCGGIAGLPCPEGFTCQLDGTYPDAGGICIKK